MPSVGTNRTDAVYRAVATIRDRWPKTPTTGIILGTGLGDLAREVEVEAEIPYLDVPHFPRSTALSHRGRLICGQFGSRTAVVMDGRCHLYEGYSVEQIALPVKVLARLGVKQLIISNASGGLNPQYRSGDIVFLEDHLDFTWRFQTSQQTGIESPRAFRPVDCYYDEDLIEQALAIARRRDVPAHRGVYAGLTGPNYETRAEYRMLRRLGTDVVGMSTIPEAVAAASLDMQVLAMSVVTNVATPDCPSKTSAEQVVADARRAGGQLRDIVLELLRSTSVKTETP